MKPSEGEVRAIVGFGGQFDLAARVVLTKMSTIEWVQLADPAAGVADDFQFGAGGTRYALQVKWSQLAGTYTWSDLTSASKDGPALLYELAQAWKRLRAVTTGKLVVCLCTNNTPSTAKAKTTSPIGKATASGTRSLATFLAQSFLPLQDHARQTGLARWADLAELPEVTQWEPVWLELRGCSGLDDDAFVSFLGDFDFSFGINPVDPLLRPDQDQADRDAEHLARTLFDIVRDPAQPTKLSRDELLARLGWTGRLRYRHPHRFPVPAAYVANDAASTQLRQRIDELAAGYVALVGPAGSGKSTLLADLVLPDHVVRYYAFVPDAPDPLSARGEAESFLHDLSLALEHTGLPRTGVGNSIATQHDILTDQLDRAGRRWTEERQRTFIVVDGLDHIAREQNPVRSLLEELPAPAALPDGVFVVLGTQTTAILPPSIRDLLGTDDRTVALPPLSDREVERIADAAGLGDWLSPGQQNRLIEASEGHPLALTYLVQELSALSAEDEDMRAEKAALLLETATGIGGNVRARYEGYLRAVADDDAVLDILSAVARLRVPINLDWLATWADRAAVIAFTQRAAIFFRRSEAEWRFVHNSFRVFLAEQTAMTTGRPDPQRERELHARLADLCASSSSEWPRYRDEELAHRLLAGDHAQVLLLADPHRLRQALTDDLRPLSTVTDHALLALRAAVELDDVAALARALLFRNELLMRKIVLEPEPLADALACVQPDAADDHLVAGGRLRVQPGTALTHAARHAEAGRVVAAQRIVRACGGLIALAADSDVDADAIADWATTTWYLSGTDAVLSQLDRHLPRPSIDDLLLTKHSRWELDRDDRDRAQQAARVIQCRSLAHARCFDLVLETRDDDALDRLTVVIDDEDAAGWRARARLVRARAAAGDGEHAKAARLLRDLRTIDATSAETDDEDSSAHAHQHAIPLHVRVAAAELLIREDPDSTAEIDDLIPFGTTTGWPQTIGSEAGLDPYRVVLDLLRLRTIRADPSLPAESLVEGMRNAADRRLFVALKALASLEAGRLQAATGRTPPPVIAMFADPVIRVLEVPHEQTSRWTGWYAVTSAAHGCFERLVRIAASQEHEQDLPRVLEQFGRAWADPGRARFWGEDRRQAVVLAALETGGDVREWAVEWLSGIDDTIDESYGDPHSRTELWLTQARAWALAGDPDKGREAIQRAIHASARFGSSDKDNQLESWIDWLALAIDSSAIGEADVPAEIVKYAARVTAVAGSVGAYFATTAAAELISLAFARHTALACELAEHFCQEGVLAEEDALEAVVLGLCRHEDIPADIATSAAAHLLYPVKRSPTDAVAEAIRARTGVNSETSLLLDEAARIWSVTDDDSSVPDSQEASPEVDATVPDTAVLPSSPGALLTELRVTPGQPARDREYWQRAVAHAATGTVSPTMSTALLEQAGHRRLDGAALGGIIALAARSGAVDQAAAALTGALARLPGYGWLNYYDGGSRLVIFDAALVDRNPVLVSLARRDLVNSIVSGSLLDMLDPHRLRRIVDLIADDNHAAAAWNDIGKHLDVLTPKTENDLVFPDRVDRPPLLVLARWLAGYLGHPVRILDFGARRVLQHLERRAPDVVHEVVAGAVRRGGWCAEAALLTMIASAADDDADKVPLAADLLAAVRAAGTNPDAIIRDLARRLAHQHNEEVVLAPSQALPESYRLAFQPLGERIPPELDRRGVPHLDLDDPRQVVAPFDLPLRVVAKTAGLDETAVMHRAAMIARSNDERWTHDGHQALANRLEKRSLRHTYRPWAYLVGRRAFGQILAELYDAGLLGDEAFPAYGLRAITEMGTKFEPSALEEWLPLPWRPEGTSTLSVGGWCQETSAAAGTYVDAYTSAVPYVLAERSMWLDLAWELPQEARELRTAHDVVRPDGSRAEAWRHAWAPADRYPNGLSPSWDDQALILEGEEPWSDAPHHLYLALHPAVGRHLGWQADERFLFGWCGSDGEWRARTVLQARGQLSHQPPAAATCAEVWQVVLSTTGYSELSAAFPGLRRSLSIKRTQRPRAERQGDEQETTVQLDEPT